MEHVPWSGLARSAIAQTPSLVPFSSDRLPLSDDLSSYSVDLAIAQQAHLELDGLGFRLPTRFRKNPKWDSLVPVWKFALCLSFDQWLTQTPSKMPEGNRVHLSESVERVFPGFGSLLTSLDPVASASHLLDEVLKDAGIRYEGGKALLMVNLVAPLHGMIAATNHYGRFYPEVGDFLSPLR